MEHLGTGFLDELTKLGKEKEPSATRRAAGISLGAVSGAAAGMAPGVLGGLALSEREKRKLLKFRKKGVLSTLRYFLGRELKKDLERLQKNTKRRAIRGGSIGAAGGAAIGALTGNQLSKISAALRTELTPQSSNVRGYSYDPKTQSLLITYRGGSTYRYKNVPPAVARSMKRSKSKGKAVNRRVKGGGFEYEKVGSEGFATDIEADTLKNKNFRKVLYTAGKEQLVLMSIPPGGDIGKETHGHLDQFIRVEAGQGQAFIGGKTYDLEDGSAVVIPAHSEHNIINTGDKPLQIYTVYSNNQHAPNAVQKTKADAEMAEKKAAKLAKSYTCKFCDEKATKGVIWAEGRAIVPACDKHLGKAKSSVSEVDTVRDLTKTSSIVLRREHKNPKGGLTAKGRSAYNKATGSNLKPGVRGKADTPEKMRRKGSFLSRMFGPGAKGPMVGPDGKPTRRALSAAAWGEPVPRDDKGRARLYAKGQSLLKRYEMQKKAEEEILMPVEPHKPLPEETPVSQRVFENLTLKAKSIPEESVATQADLVMDKVSQQRRQIAKLAGACKRQTTWKGLTMKLEYDKGDERSGVNKATGKKWSRKMRDCYGYMPGTYGKGADGEAIDIYLNPSRKEDADEVYKIRQKKKTGEYDEDKFMVGYGSAAEAKKAFLRNMPSWAFDSMSKMSLQSFKTIVGQDQKGQRV